MAVEVLFDPKEASLRQSYIIEAGGPRELGQLHELIIVVTRIHLGSSYDPYDDADVDLHDRSGQSVVHVGQRYRNHRIGWFDETGTTPHEIEETVKGRFRVFRVRLDQGEKPRIPTSLTTPRIIEVGRTIWTSHLTTPIKN